MSQKVLSCRGLWLVCGAFGLALCTNALLADDLVVQADGSEMTVTRVAQMSPVHIVSLGRRVSYGDLNFDTPAASEELERRISAAAVDVCKRLDERFPDATPNGRACIETAVKDALRKVHAGK